jgi:hypothetical protein
MDPVTVARIGERALAGLEELSASAEAVEDEWQYVTDLGTIWRARLSAVAATRGTEPAPDGAVAAIEALVAEAGRIADPHRAIDWLSTFPQVALAALGEAP